MDVLTQIFKLPRKEFKAVAELKAKVAARQELHNTLSRHVGESRKAAVEKHSEFFANPSIESANAVIEARAYADKFEAFLGESYGAITASVTAELHDSDNGLEILCNALGAYRDELGKRIRQIEEDARTLSDKSGIPYTEPAAIQTLRNEAAKAGEGVSFINEMLSGQHPNTNAKPWRTFGGLLRIGAQVGGELELPKN